MYVRWTLFWPIKNQPVSAASFSLIWRDGFGVAKNAAFNTSNCFALIVVRGPRLLFASSSSSLGPPSWLSVLFPWLPMMVSLLPRPVGVCGNFSWRSKFCPIETGDGRSREEEKKLIIEKLLGYRYYEWLQYEEKDKNNEIWPRC